MSVLREIIQDNWAWRRQIWALAKFELKKESRGAAFGWLWFFVRPLVYVFCFWFAIDIGLRASSVASGDAPFILWLTCGIIPWFFMQKMLGKGTDVMHSFPYLVNKVKFPLSAISSVYTLSSMLIQLMIQSIIVVTYFACGQSLDIHLVQIPFLLILMYVFWLFFSIMVSPLSAMSKDMKNLMNTLSTPFFWLSGVLFNVKSIDSALVQTVLYYNPITFFVTGFRDAIYSKVWIWEDPMLCIGFAIVFVVTVICSLLVYKRTRKEVADVL